jgi:hypothetical protein
LKAFTLLIALLWLVGCDVNTIKVKRSGSINNDFVEDPMPSDYQEIILTSNAILDLLKKGDFKTINTNFVHATARETISESELTNIFGKLENQVGEIDMYLTSQWGIRPKTKDGVLYTYSIKIVKHQHADMNYFFVFDTALSDSQIIGLYFKEKNGVRSPSEL